jgi:hypothetical protein
MMNKKNQLSIKFLAWVLAVVFVVTGGYFTVFAQGDDEGRSSATLSISGPDSLNENTSANYTAVVRFSDGSTRTVTSSATWSENSQYATISGGVLRAGSVTRNQTATITARYTYRERAITATKSVTIVNVSSTGTLSSLSVAGPASVNAGATASFTATATFTNGSTQNVTTGSTWSVSSSSVASINSSGVLTASQVTSNQTVTVTARYSSGGVSRTTSRSVTILAVSGARTLSSLAVTGASSVNAGATASYNATANFSDGTTQNVTTTSTWSVSSNAATISSSGVLTAARITTNSIVNVTASYTFGGVTRTASIPVTVVAVTSTRTLSSLAVAGASSVNGGSTSSYMATATFSDGTTQNVSTSSTWSLSSSVATISSSGLLTATQVTSNQAVTVTASYTFSGVTRSGSMSVAVIVSGGATGSRSINSTSQNRTSLPATPVAEQPLTKLSGYNIFAVNDLGMHCGDLDHRVVSILPPFNILHAIVIKQGTSSAAPTVLTSGNVSAIYSAVSNLNDPALLNPTTTSVYKTNFWDANAVTGNSIAYDGYNPFYPPNVLSASVMTKDSGLPFPDLELLYPVSGTGSLAADQQKMPGASGAYTTNTPQLFNLFNTDFPFFTNFAFGYRASGVNWFAADGIPLTPYDDIGRTNAFPLMRVQARTINTTLTGTTNQVIASVDAVAPVSGEATCYVCHTSTADGGNGQAACLPGYDSGCTVAGSMRSTARFAVVTASQDPNYATVPSGVSKEWAADTNILLLHDAKNGTQLATGRKPVVCQTCHYSPALDLAQVGPLGATSASANGRTQITHHTNSRALHAYHAQFTDLFATMVPPNNSQRSTGGVPAINTYVQTTLNNSCYRCHPGQTTRCLRGAMYNGGLICQDCHGNMQQVGNDFSANMTASNPYPGGANMALRVPWAKEPACGSCHTGDAMSNLSTDANVIRSNDGIRLLQAYRTNDANASPIVPTNKRFSEETASNGNRILFRLSKGHSDIACQACHGSTHAEWPVEPQSGTSIANDNLAATQIQGHTGTIMECTACHAAGSLSATLGGPHSMHPVNDSRFVSGHNNLFSNNRAQCQACHGQTGQGTVLSKVAASRNLAGRNFTKGQMVSCGACHGNPL